MSEPLTRAQRIERIVRTLRPSDPGSWDANVPYVTAEFDDHDAALRQHLAEYKNALSAAQDELFKMREQLAAMTAERDELDKDFKQVYDSYSDAVTLLHDEQKVSDDRRIQLAASTARCADLENTCKTFASYIADGVETCWAGPNPTKTEHEAQAWLHDLTRSTERPPA